MHTSDIPDTWQILCTTTPHQHDAVFLQVMSLSLNICHDCVAICELHTGDFPLRRVGFLGSHDEYLGANALLLRTVVKERRL